MANGIDRGAWNASEVSRDRDDLVHLIYGIFYRNQKGRGRRWKRKSFLAPAAAVDDVDGEVVNGLAMQVIATRNTRERNNRLENMCWRIWHLARKKKQVFHAFLLLFT